MSVGTILIKYCNQYHIKVGFHDITSPIVIMEKVPRDIQDDSREKARESLDLITEFDFLPNRVRFP